MAGQSTTTPVAIPPEIEAEMTATVKACFLTMCAQYEQQIAQLRNQIDKLEDRIAQLQGRPPRTTPQNSSLPPSSQHPHAKPKRRKPPEAKRKPGGQHGHHRHQRALVPAHQCSDIIPCIPQSCRRCGGALVDNQREPIRHQVTELPKIQPIITEYQLHRQFCPCCGITTCGQLPAGVPQGQCGPRLAALTGLLMVHFRQSKRRTAVFLEDLLNIPCSPAWTVKIQNCVSQAIKQPYEEARQQLSEQPQLFVDESPTKQTSAKAWLWVAVAGGFAVFGVFLSRKRDSLKQLIGDYSGILLNCDRAKMYYDGKRLQWCWSHLKRDIQKLIDSSDGQVKRLGHDLLRQQKLLFQHWRCYLSGELSWRKLRKETKPIRKEFEALLLRGQFSGNPRLTGMCKDLYAHRAWLWTFLDQQGVEPTNNAAERALRPAVIYRKLSFGTQSESGSRYLERMLTVSETCRMQQRSAFEYLTAVMQAYYVGQPIPSLLSSPSQASAA